MTNNQSFLANLIKNAALIKNHVEFKKEAKKHSMAKWINIHKAKVGAIGAGTGLLGGPWGLALEAADMGYLGSIMGRLCFGIGHINNKPVNYNYDMEGILAIWGGAGKGVKKEELKKIFKEKYKDEIEKNYTIYLEEINKTKSITENNKDIRNRNIPEKKSWITKMFSKIFKSDTVSENISKNYLSKEEFEDILFEEYLEQIKIDNKMIINDNSEIITNNITGALLASTKVLLKTSSKSTIKVGLKMVPKMIAKKLGIKIYPKLLSKATAKLSAKAASKFPTKWIPVLGGVVSAGVNIWVIDSIADAAKEYYESHYILILSEISDELLQEIADIKEDVKSDVKDHIELIFDD